jgi:hypothetical protein
VDASVSVAVLACVSSDECEGAHTWAVFAHPLHPKGPL